MENLFFTLPYFIANLLHTSREASPLGSTGRDKIYMYLIHLFLQTVSWIYLHYYVHSPVLYSYIRQSLHFTKFKISVWLRISKLVSMVFYVLVGNVHLGVRQWFMVVQSPDVFVQISHCTLLYSMQTRMQYTKFTKNFGKFGNKEHWKKKTRIPLPPSLIAVDYTKQSFQISCGLWFKWWFLKKNWSYGLGRILTVPSLKFSSYLKGYK